MPKWLSIGQAARILRITPDTVRAWEQQGRLRAVRTEGDHRRFDEEDVRRLAQTLSGTARPRDRGMARPMVPTMPRPVLGEIDDEQDLARQELRSARTRVEILRADGQASQILNARKAEAERQASQERENHRNEALKAFGRTLAKRLGLPADWRAALSEELEAYVVRDRFPLSLPSEEARDFVRAKVESIVQRHRESIEQIEATRRQAAAQAEAERLQAIERAETQRKLEVAAQAKTARVKELINLGILRATMETLTWDFRDREDARRDVLEELRANVRGDWDGDQVRDLVDDVLDDFENEISDEETEGDEDD
jgi:excisionase family DNA binding protein